MANWTAKRRYTWRLAGAMIAYLLTLALAMFAIRHRGVTGPAAFALALLPGISIAGAFWALARYLIEQTDEFLRLLLARQYLIATGLTMTVIVVWGTLADFGLIGHLEAHYPVWLFFIGIGIGGWINRRTHGAQVC